MGWSLPADFEVCTGPHMSGVTLIVARWARPTLLAAGIDHPEGAASGPGVRGWVGGGRVRHPVIEAGGERWLLKAYHRGGLLSRWNPDRYWRIGRFLRELETAVAAQHAGVPLPVPIALILKETCWRAYRAWQVVRYEPEVVSLRDVLETEPDSPGRGAAPAPPGASLSARARGEIFRAAGGAVRRMHEAGIDHPDLNVGNILVRASPEGRARGGSAAAAEVFIVDWDRARQRPRGTWNPNRNLLRLWRSALKLSRLRRPPGVPDAGALRAFLRGYFGGNRAGLRALRGYVRPRRLLILFHVAIWEVSRWARSA